MTQNTAKQNYPGSVASYDTQPGNEMGFRANTGQQDSTNWSIAEINSVTI